MGLAPVDSLQSISQSLAIGLLVCLLFCLHTVGCSRADTGTMVPGTQSVRGGGKGRRRERSRDLGKTRFEPHPASCLGRSQPLLAFPSSSAKGVLQEPPASVVGTRDK